MGRLNPPRPLSKDDNRDAFDCGHDSLNNWFRRRAWFNQQVDASRTSVVCDSRTGSIAGFVAMRAGHIERAYLPKSMQRNRPEPMPVILLGQLAVDLTYQGEGCARSLVIFALTTAVRFSKDIGCVGVLTHPINDTIRPFYKAFDFQDLPFDPRRGMMARIVDLWHIGLNSD